MSSVQASKDITRPHILIIDDRMESIALLLDYLKGQAVDVMVASSGEDGLRKAIAGAPQVILLDVALPGLDGYSVCRKLKSDPLTAAAPVIFLSATAAVEDRLAGFAAGGVDFIGKPFSSEEVLTRLFVHLRMARQLPQALPQPLAYAAATKATGTPRPLPTFAPRDNDLLDAALAEIQCDTGEWPGREALARKIGTNEKKLTELFRQRFGLTPYEYLVQQRLENARLRLASTAEQIQLIADRAGYQNASDFSRAFRSRYGIGPRQYRQTCLGMTTTSGGASDGSSGLAPAGAGAD